MSNGSAKIYISKDDARVAGISFPGGSRVVLSSLVIISMDSHLKSSGMLTERWLLFDNTLYLIASSLTPEGCFSRLVQIAGLVALPLG